VNSGAVLTLDDGTTISGGGTGTLTIYSGNTLDIEAGSNGPGATLDGVAVTDNGALDIGDVASGATLTLDDGTTISGDGIGTLTINAGNTLDIEVGSNGPGTGATLDGISVTDNGALDIGEVNSGAVLTLDDGTTISGGGTGTLTINSGNTLDIEAGNNAEGPFGATLDGVSVTDSGALDIGDVTSGATLTLDDGTTIMGGGISTLTINSGNTLDIEAGSNGPGATLDGVGIVNSGGLIQIHDSATLTIADTVTLQGDGTVSLASTGDPTAIVGQSDDSGNPAQLENAGNTISGVGTIGDGTGDLVLANESGSSIDANVSGETLSLDTGNTIQNAGVLEATNGGVLQISDAVDGSGAIVVFGSTVDLNNSNAASDDVTFNGAGTLEVDSSPSDGSQIYTGTISGFGGGEAIDLTQLTYSPNETLSWTQGNNGNGTLTITDGGTTENIVLAGTYTNANFSLAPDSGSGTTVLSTELVANGGFETGDFTGWTASGNGQVVAGQEYANSGNYAVQIGDSDPDFKIDQTIATVSGATYQVQFWLEDATSPSAYFSASFGGTSLVNLTSLTYQGYTPYTFDVTASGTSADLQFTANGGGGTLYLDDVSVEPVLSAPAITVPGSQTIASGEPTALSSAVGLAETGSIGGESFTVTLTDTYGQLSATAVGDGDTVSGSGTTSLTITGSSSDVNTDLATLTDTDATVGSDTITLNATDSFGDSATEQTIAVTVGSSGGGGPSPPVAPDVSLSANVPTGYASGMFVAYDSDGDSVTITGATVAGTFGTISVEDDGNGNGFVSYTTGATADEAAAVAALGANSAVDSFTYTVTDDGTSQTAQGNIDVTLNATDDGATADFWVGGGESANWNEADNWSNGTAPDQNSDALLNLPVGVIVTDSEVSDDPNHLLEYGAGLLDIGNGAALVAGADSYVTNMTLEDGASFEVTQGNLYVAGTLTMDAGSSVLVDDGTLTIGPSGVIDVETDSPGSGVTLDGLMLINNGDIEVGAATSGAILTLDGGTSIAGGRLTMVLDSGEVEVSGTAVLDGVFVSNEYLLQLDAGATLTIADTVTLGGNIGGGEVLMEAGSKIAEASTDTGSIVSLDNSNNVIEGDGQIGDGTGFLALTNSQGGTIEATISSTTLTLYTGDAITNTGALAAINGATLLIDDAVSNNSNGDINAGNNSGVTGTVKIENTITNGTTTATVNAFAGSTVELDSATISGGKVTTAAASADPVLAAGIILGDGTSAIDDAFVINNGILEANGGLFTFNSSTTVSGTGIVEIVGGGTADFQDSFDQNVMFGSGGGTLILAQPASFDTSHVLTAASGSFASNDVLDLIGYATTDTASAGSFISGNDTTTLTIYDSSHDVVQTFTLAGNQSGTTWTVTADGSNTGIDVYDPPAVAVATIAAGASLDIGAPSRENVTFTGGTGSLVLNDPENFTGQIIGFTGTAPDAAHSDTIDLVGINYDSSHFAETYNSSTGLLTVTDGTHSASLTFDDFNATLDFASDGNGGTLITDPPAAGSAGHSSASAPVKWGMNFGDDKINFDTVQPGSQAVNAAAPDGEKAASVVGDSGHDNFVFHANLGAEANINLNSHADANVFASHPNTELAQQLTALTTPGPHAAAVFDLFHDDGLAPTGITPAQIHQMIQAGHLLH
jgi:hypothetical protein